jgi:hypothetical protein
VLFYLPTAFREAWRHSLPPVPMSAATVYLTSADSVDPIGRDAGTSVQALPTLQGTQWILWKADCRQRKCRQVSERVNSS